MGGRRWWGGGLGSITLGGKRLGGWRGDWQPDLVNKIAENTMVHKMITQIIRKRMLLVIPVVTWQQK